MTIKQQQQSTKMWHPWSIASLVLDIDCVYSKMHEEKAGMQAGREKEEGYWLQASQNYKVGHYLKNIQSKQRLCCLT